MAAPILRSVRRLRLVPSAVALLVVGAVGLGACASDEDIDQAKFAADLRSRTGITEEQADCLVEKIYGEFDQSEVNRIYHAATEAEVGGETLEVLDGFNAECITAAPADEGEDDGEAPATTGGDEGDGASTTEGSTTTEAETTTTEG